MRRLAARRAALAAKLAAAVVLFGLLTMVRAPAAEFTGGYDGIGDAAGMELTLQQVGTRVVGRLTTPGGSVYAINGERAGGDTGEAQGALRLSGGTSDAAFFHIEERPLGLQFLFIPSSGGQPDMASSREFSFLKRGVRPAVPAKPESRFLPAPPPGARADITVFIDQFRRWDPRDTARLYASLDDRSRGLILLYDHATAELMWRICEAAPSEGSREAVRLAEMLERQQTDCATYLPLVEAARESGVFPEFLRRAQFQFEIVRATALCDRGETPTAKCADVSALGAPLILRWRRAVSIMADMARTAAAHPRDEPAQIATEGTETAAPEPVPVRRVPLPAPRAQSDDASVLDFEPDISTRTSPAQHPMRLPLPRPGG
ncbi:hypothetical protein [Parvibaculum sp.]|uniref:hypothetical protein n=1 Tax=Parvibaculum sp. TaxID=2024848 RepID=UPI001DBB6E46|nr:hypothetical protein [Parvibaculum sp.]MBX3488345.1 hypothetical protein [Parvibaculum sp.]MCW5727677.1 hypothetical protein [Parvibaculum sp.]